MHTWSEKVLLGAISACCVCDTWWLRSVKYLEFHALLCGGRVARLKGSGNVWTFKIPEFFLFFYHLLGKVPFPTVWELCLIINTCALSRCSKKKKPQTSVLEMKLCFSSAELVCPHVTSPSLKFLPNPTLSTLLCPDSDQSLLMSLALKKCLFPLNCLTGFCAGRKTQSVL